MSYKNTMKLFVSNFTLAWKQLVYLLFCVFLFALCSYTLVSPVITILKEAGLFAEIKNLMNMFYNNPKDIAMTLSQVVKIIFSSIINNFSKIYINVIFTIILCVILPYILYQMSIYNLSSVLYQKVTMNMDVSFCQNFISNFWKSLKFALVSFLFSLGFFIINIGLIVAYILIANNMLKAIIGLIILSLLSLIVNAGKLAIFSYFTGNAVENESNPLSVFLKSFSITMKNFGKVWANSIVIILTSILINGVIGLFTFFAGLLFTIPATSVLMCIFKIVTYLNLSGNRYYLSSTIIYNPQKYVVKKDDYVHSFVPPEETKEITTTKMKKNFKSKTLTKKSKKNKKVKG